MKMKRYDKYLSVLAVISVVCLLAQCKHAYPVEMPKLDRSGMYYIMQYEFDNETQELVDYHIVKDGTFTECIDFIQHAGPVIQHNGTHTIYGCERQRIHEGTQTQP
jgi:hypothetical protein